MSMCVQEEEMIKCNNGGVHSANLAKHNNKKMTFVPRAAHVDEEKGKGMARPPTMKDQCKSCFKRGHYQKTCIEFLKHLNQTVEDHVIFVNESLFSSYAKSTRWID
jgi:hypothetical protein